MQTKTLIDRFYEDVAALDLRFPVAEICRRTGYSKTVASDYLSKKKTPSQEFIEKFYEGFSGELTELRESSVPYLAKRREIKNGDKKIPFTDIQAAGSDLVLGDNQAVTAPTGTIDVGDLLRDSQAAIRVYGNSMLPNYPSGCVIGLVQVTTSYIEPGEVYVIETRDRRLIKRLFYKDDLPEGDVLTCVSDNTMKFEGGSRSGKLAYPAFDIPKSEIINLFSVTGVIKRNMNSVILNRTA